MSATDHHRFRFVDNQEKFLLFTTTCSEKLETAERIGREFRHLEPVPPALRLFQAGAGEGSLLNVVLRRLHFRWPTIPFLVVVKETNADFIRLAVRHLADRFREHPELVLVFTNVPYRTDFVAATAERPRSAVWRDLALEGTTSHRFESQLNDTLEFLAERWRTTSPTGHGGQYEPTTVLLYRADQRYALDLVIPRPDSAPPQYDLVVASQPYRSRLSTRSKVDRLLAPLATRIAPGGRMIVIQSAGRDPGMEIVQAIWPGERPFASPRRDLLQALHETLAGTHPDLEFVDPPGDAARFQFRLQLNPEDVDSNIGTSTLLAAWNAAAYVAQIDEQRLTRAISRGAYLDATRNVLERHRGLWFNNECFLVVRRNRGS